MHIVYIGFRGGIDGRTDVLADGSWMDGCECPTLCICASACLRMGWHGWAGMQKISYLSNTCTTSIAHSSIGAGWKWTTGGGDLSWTFSAMSTNASYKNQGQPVASYLLSYLYYDFVHVARIAHRFLRIIINTLVGVNRLFPGELGTEVSPPTIPHLRAMARGQSFPYRTFSC